MRGPGRRRRSIILILVLPLAAGNVCVHLACLRLGLLLLLLLLRLSRLWSRLEKPASKHTTGAQASKGLATTLSLLLG